MKNKLIEDILKNKEIILLSLIILFGVFLRLYSLGNSPLWVDESISSETAKQILNTGVPRFESGMIDTRAFVFHYIQSFFMIFGINEFSVRLVSVLFGILTIFFGYYIGKEYSKSGGIIFALFLSVFYLEVFFSRQARMYQMFQLLFFLSIYFLYKSKENVKYLYWGLIILIVCYDTHIAGIVLAPFFLIYILVYNRNKWYLSFVPVFLLIWNFMPIAGLSSNSVENTVSYASSYLAYLKNWYYLVVLFVLGGIWSFFKKKELTFLILTPSLLMLFGVFSLETFALRYEYFFIFPLVMYSSLLIAFLYDKYGKIILIPLLILFIVPSNLFYPLNYVNIITPINYNYNDASAPYTDYKNLPTDLLLKLKSNTTLISFFSLDVKWYVKNPDFVIPFSLDGRGNDQISFNSSNGNLVDRYSGVRILNYSNLPEIPYYVLADSFSVSKLKPSQNINFNTLIANCSLSYSATDLKVYSC
ncbi:MAG: glycosyltransferase family 39 protein [Nanoarchaeota archaeon]